MGHRLVSGIPFTRLLEWGVKRVCRVSRAAIVLLLAQTHTQETCNSMFFLASHIRYLPNADYRRVEVERAWAVCLFQCLLHNFDARLSDMYKGPAVEAASTQPLVSLHLVGELH